MAGIFISHAAADKKLVDSFVDNVVRLGCGVPPELIFYSSGADTGVPSGENLNSYVRKKVRHVKLVVALITPTFQTRPFCIAELGAAWSKVGNLFPLVAPQLGRDDMEGVLAGMVIHEMTEGTALDELHDRIAQTVGLTSKSSTWGNYKSQWLKAADDLLPLPVPETPVSLIRPAAMANGSKTWGQIFEGFVDAALYTADDSVGRAEIVKAADLRTLIPNRYLYSSDSGADNWVRLCEDRMYSFHKDSIDYWSSAAGRGMAGLIKQEVDQTDFDYVSLGPGDGQKDAALIDCWLEAGSDLFYYPYDVSLPLVSRAIGTVRDRTDGAAGNDLHIKAVLADFKHLNTVSEVFRHRDSPNVVALLGNSLGNLAGELGFLHNLSRAMSEDDLLIIEVRLKSNNAELPELETPQSLRFDFGPLEHYLGLTFDVEKMTTTRRTGISSIPNTTTTVVACKDIEIPGTEATEAKLIYIHEYTEKDFLDALKEKFHVVERKPGNENERFLVCVVRKRTGETT